MLGAPASFNLFVPDFVKSLFRRTWPRKLYGVMYLCNNKTWPTAVNQFLKRFFVPNHPVYSRGSVIAGHCNTTILPSSSRSSVGAYNPSCSRLHHSPCACFSSGVVNQYCHSTDRTCLAGAFGN